MGWLGQGSALVNSIPFWARIEDVPPASCAQLVRDLGDGVAPSLSAAGVRWLLAYCHDGVVWGRRNSQGSWSLSTDAFPDISPRIAIENLVELRLFGPEAEILVWRVERGYRGRVLSDAEGPLQGPEFARPLDREALILGDRVLKSNGRFTLLGDASGRRHAIACEVDEEDVRARRISLAIRDYLSVDDTTGTVRISASRLVDLVKRGGGTL